MILLLHISHMEIFANWRACWSSVFTKYEKLAVLDRSLIGTDGPSCTFGNARSSDVGISRELVGGIVERKSWSVILAAIVPSRNNQPTQIARTTLWNKQINILQTGFLSTSLGVVFILPFASLQACNESFSVWMYINTKQNGDSTQSTHCPVCRKLGERCVVCLQFFYTNELVLYYMTTTLLVCGHRRKLSVKSDWINIRLGKVYLTAYIVFWMPQWIFKC